MASPSLPTAASSGHAYRPEIDGLRAIAVLSVVLYHLRIPAFSGGFGGVDVFFTISGYLIFGIIWQKLEDGTFSYRSFYTRRLLRLLPAMLVVSAATLLVGAWWLLPFDLARLGVGIASTMTYLSNVWLFRNTGYFEARAELLPTLHTWSLSVEEQFYFVAPLGLVALHRHLRSRALPVLLLLGLTTLAASQFWLESRQPMVFYLSPFRTWEFIVGGVLAIGSHDLSAGRATRLWAWLGLAGVLGPVFLFTAATKFPGLAAVVPCGATALLLISTGPAADGTVKRLLAIPVLTWLGRLSYSLYLWHWPVIVLWSHVVGKAPGSEPGALVIGVQALVTLALAAATHAWVEQPLRSPSPPRVRAVVVASLGASALLLLAGLGLKRTHGWVGRVSPTVAAIDAEREPEIPFRGCFGPGVDVRTCRLGAAETTVAPTWLVWGDSHALSLAPAFDALLRERGESGLLAASSLCPPLLGVSSRSTRLGASECAPLLAQVERLLEDKGTLSRVVLVGAWPGYVSVGTGVMLADGAGERGNALVLADGLARTMDKVLNNNRTMWVIHDVPRVPWDVPFELGRAALHGRAVPRNVTLAETRAQSAPFDGLLTRALNDRETKQAGRSLTAAAKIALVDLPARFCPPDGTCVVADEAGLPLYRDGDHVNVRGARFAMPALRAALTPELGQR